LLSLLYENRLLFNELYSKWRIYPNHWDISYKDSLESGIWDSPDKNIREKIDFLNKWLCRVDRKTACLHYKQLAWNSEIILTN